MVDFTTYQPPGVYVEEDPTTLVTVVGLQPTVVALVGPARGYRLGTETVVLDGVDPVPLSNLGVDVATVVVTDLAGDPYVEGTDYDLAGLGNETTIARVGGGGITDGATVYVSYHYTDPDYYNPLRLSDLDDAIDAYGPPLDLATGEIISPLSFAAKVAFDNGARNLVLVATTGDIDSLPVTTGELTAAYAKLEALTDVSLLVPLPVGITGTAEAPGDTIAVGEDLRTHLTNMEADGLFRVGVLGYESSVTVEPVPTASSVTSKRVILAWPQVLRYYHGMTNTTIDVSGYYLATAYAGRMASLPVQMPLTRKQVGGFNGFPPATQQSMTNNNKNEWSAGGVSVTEEARNGRMQVRHGVTTDKSSAYVREISLVRSKDALVTLIQQTVEAAELIGSWIDGDTVGQVKGVVAGALEAAVGTQLIFAYNDLKGRQLASDPSVIEIKFQYKPSYPLNYIVISFSINTETGETTLVEEGA